MNSSNACIRIAVPADWEEFGDNARKIKWVDEIARQFRKNRTTKIPYAPPRRAAHRRTWPANLCLLQERVDTRRPPVRLHAHRASIRLDCYYLYNPDNYYPARSLKPF